jgi:hypothetical protein
MKLLGTRDNAHQRLLYIIICINIIINITICIRVLKVKYQVRAYSMGSQQ